jgi:hypothetical protein|tara:strand:- start:505 stop:702 length:198 start_codon:yes stop_codon:yes gene_type:complete
MKNENQITATVKLMNDVSLTEKFSSDNAAMTWVTSQNSTGILAEWMIDTGWKSVTNMLQSEIIMI